MKLETPFKLSVITVCLNSEATIGRTLQSLRDQNDKRFESIVIDGGSTDGTHDLIRDHADVISHFVSEKDGGIYEAMNKGIRMANGSHLSFLNSDDAYFQHTVERVGAAAASNPDAILYGKMVKERLLGDRILTREESPDLEQMPRTMGLFHPATFTPAHFFQSFGPYDTRFGHAADYHWFLRAFLKGVDFEYIDHPLAVFRLGGVSTGSSYREAARIQRELQTGHHLEMEKLYRKCRWKMRRTRMLTPLLQWPLIRELYSQRVKKRWK